MSMAATVEVKGWCPGVLRPMQSGDGLIARVRPWGGAIGLTELAALADAAERFGSGHVDLTRRANLQVRGLSETSLLGLQEVVSALGLADHDARTEAVRNVMVSPLAGLDPDEKMDVRPMARALERGLASDPVLYELPSKFGFVVDGGGAVSIASERADIALRAVASGVAMGLDTAAGTRWLGTVATGAASDVALAAANAFLRLGAGRRRLRDLDALRFAELCRGLSEYLSPLGDDTPARPTRPLGVLPLGGGRWAVGVAAAFGRLEAHQLGDFAALAAAAGATAARTSPWRAFYVEARDLSAAQRLVAAARDLCLIVEANDPILRIDACPGAPACRSASVDARRDARRLSSLAFAGSIHVSGCAKGCARSAQAELVLVGECGRYKVIRNGTTRAAAERTIEVADLEAVFDV